MAVNARTATHPIAPTTNIVSSIRTARTNMQNPAPSVTIDLVTVPIPVHHKVHKESVKTPLVFSDVGLRGESEKPGISAGECKLD
jgi:hypothetical protein